MLWARIDLVEARLDKLEAKSLTEQVGTREWRCYDCGVMITTTGTDGPVCPNGHLSPRIIPLDSPDAEEMLADLDQYIVKQAQAAAAAQVPSPPGASEEPSEAPVPAEPAPPTEPPAPAEAPVPEPSPEVVPSPDEPVPASVEPPSPDAVA